LEVATKGVQVGIVTGNTFAGFVVELFIEDLD
jgi:hypothetical protein